MFYKSNKSILITSSQGVTLRSLDPLDAADLFLVTRPNKDWLPQFPLGALTIEQVEDFCYYAQHSSLLGDGLMAGVWMDNQMVGHVGTHARDHERTTGELTCWMAPGYQGRGIDCVAAELALDHAFNRVGMREMVAVTVPHNHHFRTLLTAFGFQSGDTVNYRRPGGTSMVCTRYRLQPA